MNNQWYPSNSLFLKLPKFLHVPDWNFSVLFITTVVYLLVFFYVPSYLLCSFARVSFLIINLSLITNSRLVCIPNIIYVVYSRVVFVTVLSNVYSTSGKSWAQPILTLSLNVAWIRSRIVPNRVYSICIMVIRVREK